MNTWKLLLLSLPLAAACDAAPAAPQPAPAAPLAGPGCGMEVVAHLTPRPTGKNPFDPLYTEVAAKNGIAYLGAEHGAGVLVLDVATGQQLGALDAGLAARINSVATDGNLLAFAPGYSGLVVYDISDPRAPARRAQQSSLRYCHTVFVHRDIVYCSTSSPGTPHVGLFRVTTPADPAAPLELTPAGSVSLPPSSIARQPGEVMVHDLFVQERGGRTLAYLAYWERGVVIVDVTDPASPQLVGATAPMPGHWVHSVWVEGDYAYVGEENYKGPLRVFDVSDPATPVEVGELHSTEGDASSVHNVQVAGGFVYASWYQDGLRAFPLWGGAQTSEVAWFHTWNGADNRDNPAPRDTRFAGNWDVFVEGELIYAADMQTGLWVLRHQTAGAACGSDQSRGTSAYAKSGRPPFGWSWSQPWRVRAGRSVQLVGVLESVDPSFQASNELMHQLQPRLTLRGLPLQSPTEVDDLPDGRLRPWRRVHARVQIPAATAEGGLWLEAEMVDDGIPRKLVEKVETLEAPAPNQDIEPNEDVYTSGLLRPDPAGYVSTAGTLDRSDFEDVYLYEMPPEASAARVRVVSPQGAERARFNAVVSAWEPESGEYQEPVQQVISDSQGEGPQLENVVTVARGRSGTVAISIRAFIDDVQRSMPYTVEVRPAP